MNEVFEKHQPFIVEQTRLLLSSYRHWLHRDLLSTSPDVVQNAKNLFKAPFAVLSSGPDADSILNYGNETAIRLWEMEWERFCRTPSRQTAEPMHRDARAVFLEQVREKGYVENYEGIRISSQGKRFHIQKATVWNLIDDKGQYAGQAATFSQWGYCE